MVGRAKRLVAALTLSLLLAVTGLALAMARGEMAVICAGGVGPTIVPLDEAGGSRFCPDAGLALLAAVAAVPAGPDRPPLRLVAVLALPAGAGAVGAAVPAPSARGPPAVA